MFACLIPSVGFCCSIFEVGLEVVCAAQSLAKRLRDASSIGWKSIRAIKPP